jgi:hypothetical protein
MRMTAFKRPLTVRNYSLSVTRTVIFHSVVLILLGKPLTALCESSLTPSIADLERQISVIQEESQRKLDDLQLQTNEQIRLLREQIASLSEVSNGQQPNAASKANGSNSSSGKRVALGDWQDRLTVSGDARIRYEYNSSVDSIPAWDRGVVRGRLRGHYHISDYMTLGARMVTGDRNNPRTADVTIGDFVSDLEVSLDQFYLSYENQHLQLVGGKFAKPFTSTEIVWDGDVNPQGIGGSYELAKSKRWSSRISGVYFLINESIFEQGSEMLGGQFSWTLQPTSNWSLSLHAAYYDYDIGTLNPDVPGGARGNYVSPDGTRYLSDFNLFDTIGSVTYVGFGDRWPVKLIGDYIKNSGAMVPEDAGWSMDLFAGNLNAPGHFLAHYGYSQVETDAILGMFSNDNIIFPTNYRLHTISLDYALQQNTFVGVTGYLFKRLQGTSYANDWASRVRFNLWVTF